MGDFTNKMSLATWDNLLDFYNYQQLANNWQIIDFHDHSPGRGVPISTGGLAAGAVTSNILAANAVQIQHLNPNLAADLGLGSRGYTNIPSSETVSSTSYATMPTQDLVNVTLPTNGMIIMQYQAVWKESVAGAGRAAVFLGTNQIKMIGGSSPQVQTTAAATGSSSAVNAPNPLFATPVGLGTFYVGAGAAPTYSGDVTTGQILGGFNSTGVELGGTVNNLAGLVPGPIYLFATAGNYNVSVQFKASSGSVTALNRKLWVWTIGFA